MTLDGLKETKCLGSLDDAEGIGDCLPVFFGDILHDIGRNLLAKASNGLEEGSILPAKPPIGGKGSVHGNPCRFKGGCHFGGDGNGFDGGLGFVGFVGFVGHDTK